MIGKLVDKIRDSVSKIMEHFSAMTPKQKFASSIVFLICMFIIVKIFNNIISYTSSVSIDYKTATGSSLYSDSTLLTDKDVYVNLKLVADDFIAKILGEKSYDGETITLSDIYENIMLSSYTDNISKSKFKSIVTDFTEKINHINENYLDFLPTNIVTYTDDFYVLKYKYEIDGEQVESYLGIALDTNNSKYYVWYIE